MGGRRRRGRRVRREEPRGAVSCVPYRRNQNPDRCGCMLPPMLGMQDYRIIVAGTYGWTCWDTMQFMFDDLAEQFEERNAKLLQPLRVILMLANEGEVSRMAGTMARARYGWATEVHPTEGWSANATRKTMAHMAKLSPDRAIFFRRGGEWARKFGAVSMWAGIGEQVCKRFGIHHTSVAPMHELELFARKAAVDPPKLGE